MKNPENVVLKNRGIDTSATYVCLLSRDGEYAEHFTTKRLEEAREWTLFNPTGLVYKVRATITCSQVLNLGYNAQC